MANAKNITSARSNTLLIGDAGTHKTFFAGTVPGNYVFDFDAGMATLRGRDIEYDTFKDLGRYTPEGGAWIAEPWHNEQGLYTFGHGWDAFYKKFMEKMNLIKTKAPNAPKAITFDSLTMMSMLAVNKILKDTGQPAPHQGTWGAHHEYFKTIFSMATALPVQLIATAHIQRDNNDLTGVTEKLPLLVGKMAAMIPIFFDEVYFCQTDVDAVGAKKWWIETSRTPAMTQAKSRWNVPNKTPTDYAEISKFFGPVPPKGA